MTFPTFDGLPTDDDDVSTNWKTTRTLAGQVRDQVTALRDKSASQSVTASELIEIISSLTDSRGLLAIRAAEDIVAALNTVLAQIDTTVAMVRSSIPVDANGRLLYKT